MHMDRAEMDIVLDEIKAAREAHAGGKRERQDIWWKMHKLAEAQYVPALEFFVSCLEDPDWTWRLDALRCIGFHFQFPWDGAIAAKIRHMLLIDPGGDGQIRSTAASVLGARSRWPDAALINALRSDPDELVRHAAFDALLELAGVPFSVKRQKVENVEEGAAQPTWEEVVRVLAAAGTNPPGSN